MPPPHARRLVAVVNHNQTMLSLMRAVIEDSGYNAITLSGGDPENVLDFVSAHQPDLVIYDVPWPYPEQLAEYERVRADPRAAGIHWLCVSTSPDVARRVVLLLGDPSMQKPFDMDEFIEVVGGLLETEVGALPRLD